MPEKSDTKIQNTPAAGWVIAYAVLASIGSVSYGLYAFSLPFVAAQGLPHILLAGFLAVAIASLYLASTHTRSASCPWIKLAWGMIVATPAFGAMTYVYPNPLTLAVAMVFALPSAFIWALSAAGAWHDANHAASAASRKGV